MRFQMEKDEQIVEASAAVAEQWELAVLARARGGGNGEAGVARAGDMLVVNVMVLVVDLMVS
jgi:hypothetical protein